MSGRRDGAGGSSQSAPRQNEYFVPRDGIDREVITADICRYLGNDALVRPGTYTDPSTGQMMQGYRVTAYRALTSAMIQDLKNDSARWERERRSHSGGTISSRNPSVFPVRSRHSNSPPARYGDSSSRFGNGSAPAQYETSASPYSKASSRDSYEVVPRYPGNDAPGYSGGGSGPPPQNYQYDSRQPQYSNPGYPQGSSFAPPAQDSRYGAQPPQGGSFPSASYGTPVYHPDAGGAPYMDVGANRPIRYQDPNMSAGGSYGAPSSSAQYYGQGQYSGGQPLDPMYGRGNYPDTQGSRPNTFSTTQPEYSSPQAQSGYEYGATASQFESANAAAPLPRGATSSPTTTPAQTGTSGSSHPHSHRHRDRDTRDGSYSKSERNRRPQ
ncbi:hypothetical protein BD289DRAFT_220579 [Coniella lustricola]|uniref:Transcription factor RfeG n=1 Tax=Coniella lustricola TaxID=2025994 RepID=A0A2T3ALN6_9PEZI|nr:hypothetical protein BD289DRAFT_220579 [Coniella lustricola]